MTCANDCNTYGQGDRQTHTQRYTQTVTHRDRQTDTERDKSINIGEIVQICQIKMHPRTARHKISYGSILYIRPGIDSITRAIPRIFATATSSWTRSYIRIDIRRGGNSSIYGAKKSQMTAC